MQIDDLLSRLKNVRQAHDGEYIALCPGHDDHEPSLSIKETDGKILVKCFAGCELSDILKPLGLEPKDLFLDGHKGKAGEGGATIPPKSPATMQPLSGCTLEQYSEAKGLPIDFLRAIGLSEASYVGGPAVRIPYFDEQGSEVAIRFRVGLTGDNRFRWKSGTKPCLYGLSSLVYR